MSEERHVCTCGDCSPGFEDQCRFEAELRLVGDEVMEAQADLQGALGMLRVKHGRGFDEDERLTKVLARLHALLAALDRPMYKPAIHPDVVDVAKP